MPDHAEQPRIAPITAFRPAGVPIPDALIGEHRAGFAEEVVTVAAKPGAVPPPVPTRPAPRQPLAERLRAMTERG